MAYFSFSLVFTFPSLKWKRIPDKKDQEIMELHFAKARALATSVPTRFVIETFSMLPRFTAIDISKIDKGFAMLAAMAFNPVLLAGTIGNDQQENYKIHQG